VLLLAVKRVQRHRDQEVVVRATCASRGLTSLLVVLFLCAGCGKEGKTTSPEPPLTDSTNIASFTEFTPPAAEKIIEDPSTGGLVVSDRVTMHLREDTTADDVAGLAGSVSARIVGRVERFRTCELELPASASMSQALERLNGDPRVAFAVQTPLAEMEGRRDSHRPHGGRIVIDPRDVRAIPDLFAAWRLVRAPLAWSVATGGSDIVLAIIPDFARVTTKVPFFCNRA
jgi:hypothetical protein